MPLMSPNHPSIFMDDLPVGMNAFGRFVDFAIEQDDQDRLVAVWEVESLDGHPVDVWIFQGDVCIDHTSKDYWYIKPASLDERVNIEFVVLPRGSRWQDYRDFIQYPLANRVSIAWTNNGDNLRAIRIYKNLDGETDVNTGFPIKVLDKPSFSSDIPGASLSGLWEDTVDNTATIDVEVTTGGAVGTAVLTYTFGGVSKAVLTSTNKRDIGINGIQVKFADTGQTYTLAATYTITVELPETWTTNSLPNGLHKFQVGAVNQVGAEVLNTAGSVTIETVPSPPTWEADEYVDTSFEIGITFSIPDESDIKFLRVYKNLPPLLDIDYLPIQDISVTPDSTEAVTVKGLRPGLNRIIGRCVNSRFEEQNLDAYTIQLDNSGNEEILTNAPAGIKATINSDYTITVQVFGVPLTCETVNIYRDDADGDIDYTTPIATITNTNTTNDFATLSKTDISALGADGIYIFAARCESSSGYEDTNTTVIDLLDYSADPATAVSDMTLEVIA